MDQGSQHRMGLEDCLNMTLVTQRLARAARASSGQPHPAFLELDPEDYGDGVITVAKARSRIFEGA